MNKSILALATIALLTIPAIAAVNSQVDTPVISTDYGVISKYDVWLTIAEINLTPDLMNITLTPVEEIITEGTDACITEAAEFNNAATKNFSGLIAYCIPLGVDLN